MFLPKLYTIAVVALLATAARAQSTFQREVDGVNGLFCLEESADGTLWAGAFLGHLLRFTPDGQWIGGASIRLGDTASARFIYDLEKTADGGVWALYDRSNENTALDDHLILGRLGPDGMPQWQRTVFFGEVQHWAHNRLASDAAGNTYVLSAVFAGAGAQSNRVLLAKVDPAGNMLWTRAYAAPGTNFPRALLRLSDGSLLVAGNGQAGNSYGFLLRLSPDGEVLWSRRSQKFLFKAAAELPDGSWALAATEAGPLPQPAVVLRCTAAGTVTWARRLVLPYALNWTPTFAVLPDGDLALFNHQTVPDEPGADVLGISAADGTVNWARRYDGCYSRGASAGLLTLDGGLAALRFRPGGHLLLKTDVQGYCATCPAETIAVPTEPLSDQLDALTWQSEDRLPPVDHAADFLPFSVTVRDFCGAGPAAQGLIASADTVCAGAAMAIAVQQHDRGEYYAWTTGGIPATGSGPSVTATYDMPGAYTIRVGTRHGFCRDTFVASLTVLPGPLAIDLGPPDTTLCGAGATLLLDATTPGATAYRWHDGDTAAVRFATVSGLYAVTASQGPCVRHDSIRVELVPDLDVGLPADTVLCQPDEFVLDAAAGSGTLAEVYRWSDGFEGRQRIVETPGTYAVTATLGPCIAADTLTVAFFNRPAALPADTVICAGAPLVVQTPSNPGGSIYWNAQPGAADFSFDSSGWLRRTVTLGPCRADDSVFVRRVPCEDGFSVFAPTAFAPDGEPGNAGFQLFGPGLEVVRLQVFDRWGTLVFQSNAPPCRWDGRHTGAAAAPGVYIWTAEIRQYGRIGRKKGDVTLIRG